MFLFFFLFFLIDQLPRLHTLVLANNRLQNLAELDPLASLANSLTTLSLLDNVVTKKPKYRPYVIRLLPKLKLLDFRKVKQKVGKNKKSNSNSNSKVSKERELM